jgi:hypothetical protein
MKGIIRSQKIGRLRLYALADIKAFLEKKGD